MTRLSLVSFLLLAVTASAWVQQSTRSSLSSSSRTHPMSVDVVRMNLFKTEERTTSTAPPPVASVEETTEKYGLEAGLFQSMKQKDGGESAKSLLKKYGIAYLATSIPLAIVSFAICYALVDNGVDVSSLLAKVGIETTQASETAGTAAIAYAAHKAASPIRFPPTVLLTPYVAKLIGKEANDDSEDEEQ